MFRCIDISKHLSMKIDKNTKVLAFMNAYTEGKSGGDVAFIEIFRRLKFTDLTVVTSLLGRKLCVGCGLKAKYVLTSKENKFSQVVLTYFSRIARAIFISARHDLIYSSSDSLPDILPAFFVKLRNNKSKWIVKRYHDIPKERHLSYFFQKISMFLINKFSDKVIQNGKFGFDHIDFEKIPISKQKFDAVFMSRLHPSKGIFDLIKIWKNVVLKMPSATLGIIGEGNRRIVNKLAGEIQKQDLQKNIKLLGFLEEKKAFSIIKSAKLFLFPSHEEAFGIVLGEIMMCQVPIITYALPDLKWCRNYVFQVPYFEKEYFVKLICKLLADSKKRIKYVDEACKFAKNFTWEKAAENEKELINSF